MGDREGKVRQSNGLDSHVIFSAWLRLRITTLEKIAIVSFLGLKAARCGAMDTGQNCKLEYTRESMFASRGQRRFREGQDIISPHPPSPIATPKKDHVPEVPRPTLPPPPPPVLVLRGTSNTLHRPCHPPSSPARPESKSATVVRILPRDDRPHG